METRSVFYGQLPVNAFGKLQELVENTDIDDRNSVTVRKAISRQNILCLDKVAFFDHDITTSILSKSEKAIIAYLNEVEAPPIIICRAPRSTFLEKWVYVAGFIFDLAVRRALLQGGYLREQPEDYWLWIYNYHNPGLYPFGVRAWKDSREMAIARVWINGQDELQLDSDDVAVFFNQRNKKRLPADGLNLVDIMMKLLKLKHLGLISKDGFAVPTIPVVHAGNGRELIRRTSAAADRILSDGILPFFQEISQEIEDVASQGVSQDCVRQATVRLLMERAAFEMLRMQNSDLSLKYDRLDACWAMDSTISSHFLPDA